MKILIVSQHYWPENFRITDIAETLSSLGNEVTVLCGLPNYPRGYVFEDYLHGKNRSQERNGVKIVRAREIGRRNNILFRFLNYWSFPHYAKKMVKKLDKDFDVVLINELSPIMSAKPGLEYAKKNGKRIVMYEMDLWPESLLAGGVGHNSLIYRHYKRVSSKIYSCCDKILVSTKEHEKYIKSLPNCSNLDIDYLPQYAESIFEEMPLEEANGGTINFMFAGNIGKAQSVDTIVRAAAALSDDCRFKFHIVGGGSEFLKITKLAKDLNANNIVFYGEKPLSEMPSLYKIADAMIVSLENESYANMTMPGKIQSYMAAGKPIICCANGCTSTFIRENKIGLVAPSGDHRALSRIFSNVSFEDLKRMGMVAKQLYAEKFSKKVFIFSLLNALNSCKIN